MSMGIQGLSEFQRDLMEVAQRRLPREMPKVMRKLGSKARTAIAKEARSKVKKGPSKTYHKRFKRGKVFKGNGGNEIVVRVYNSSPHAHLIEHGYRLVKNGNEIGFVPGKFVMRSGADKFDNSGEPEKIITEWLDKLLESGRL